MTSWQPRPSSGPVRLVRPVPVDPTGQDGPTRGQAQGPRWRQTSRGFHVPAWVDDSVPEQRILEQSMRLPDGGAVTGWAAARLHGATYLDGLAPDGRTRLPVPLALGRGGNIRKDGAAALDRDLLDPAEVTVVRGVRCTTPERAVFDAMRTAGSLVEAVVVLDMAAEGEVTSPARMADYLRGRAGWRGVPLARDALPLASEHSWSPNETRMRMVWRLESRLPEPLLNRPLFDLRGRLLGFPDLLDEDAGLVGEFDGAGHRLAARHSDDVGREALFRRFDLEVFRVTGPDLVVPGRVRDRILDARRRARWLPPERRLWTTKPPPWWDRGPTLEERLALRDVLAEERRWP